MDLTQTNRVQGKVCVACWALPQSHHIHLQSLRQSIIAKLKLLVKVFIWDRFENRIQEHCFTFALKVSSHLNYLVPTGHFFQKIRYTSCMPLGSYYPTPTLPLPFPTPAFAILGAKLVHANRVQKQVCIAHWEMPQRDREEDYVFQSWKEQQLG